VGGDFAVFLRIYAPLVIRVVPRQGMLCESQNPGVAQVVGEQEIGRGYFR
jgi:hypothetical protein